MDGQTPNYTPFTPGFDAPTPMYPNDPTPYPNDAQTPMYPNEQTPFYPNEQTPMYPNEQIYEPQLKNTFDNELPSAGILPTLQYFNFNLEILLQLLIQAVNQI